MLRVKLPVCNLLDTKLGPSLLFWIRAMRSKDVRWGAKVRVPWVWDDYMLRNWGVIELHEGLGSGDGLVGDGVFVVGSLRCFGRVEMNAIWLVVW